MSKLFESLKVLDKLRRIGMNSSPLLLLLLLGVCSLGGAEARSIEYDYYEEDDSSGKDETVWNTALGFFMYALMVLFFALQVVMIIFCFGIFLKKVYCESDQSIGVGPSPDDGNLVSTNTVSSAVNEKNSKVLKVLKNPKSKDVIVFSPDPEAPVIINNWVGEGFAQSSESLETLPPPSLDSRCASRMSTRTTDSWVPPGGHKWCCPICLSPRKNKGALALPCLHAFHHACLRDYVVYALESDSPVRCPICRLKLKVDVENKS